MKKLIAILLTIFIFAVPLTVCAEESRGDFVHDIAERDVFTYEGTTLPYRYILPEDYNMENTYPLVVFLHAEPERGNDNISQLKHGVNYIVDKMPSAIILAPQCTLGNQWVDTPVEGGSYSIAKIPESNELAAVMALITKMQTDYMVDTERIYAVGASMGGYGVWDLMMRHNETFAAGVVLCGAGDPSQAELLKDTPMYVFHGALDEVLSPSVAREVAQSIYDAGGTKLRYFEIAKNTHEMYYQLWWGEGVMENLLKHRASDKYISEDEDVVETIEEQGNVSSNEEENVVDAGVVTPPSIGSIIIYIIGVLLALTILIIIVVRIKKI